MILFSDLPRLNLEEYEATANGLGMAIVRNIVRFHGRTVTFETAPDQGTAFLISIPQELTCG